MQIIISTDLPKGKQWWQFVGFNEVPSGGYFGISWISNFMGNPYSRIQMNINEYAYGSNPDVNYLASVLTHEMGHCIASDIPII